MIDENGVWRTKIASDGRELVSIGTPEFPLEMFGLPEEMSKLQEVPWHWHEEMEINVSVGEGEVMMADGKNFRTRDGQGLFVNGGVLHGAKAVREGGSFRHYSLVFNPSVVGGAPGSVFWQKYLAPLMNAPEARCVPLTGEAEWEKQLIAHFLRIVEQWTAREAGYEFSIRAELSQIVFLLAENSLKNAPLPSERELRDAERIKKMVDYIRIHADEPITTDQIARSAAVSVSECLRCFRRMMDLTPKEYLRQHRVRHAATLLEKTDKSITQIGAECGFEDMSYFARVFREEKGCTPTQYRERRVTQSKK